MAKSSADRAATRYAETTMKAPEPNRDSGIYDVAALASKMAPKGIGTDTMRRSENIEDNRQPAEETIGTPQGDASGNLVPLLDLYMKGGIDAKKLREMFPEPGEAKDSKLAEAAGSKHLDKMIELFDGLKALGKKMSAPKTAQKAAGEEE